MPSSAALAARFCGASKFCTCWVRSWFCFVSVDCSLRSCTSWYCAVETEMFRTSTAMRATARMPKQSTTNGARRFRGADRTSDSGVRAFRDGPVPGVSPGQGAGRRACGNGEVC